LFDLEKLSLDPGVGATKFPGLPRDSRSNGWNPQPQHVLDATRILGPLDLHPIPKSIVKVSHTALLGLPQPRVSNLPNFAW
jgi:hypothetical protein